MRFKLASVFAAAVMLLGFTGRMASAGSSEMEELRAEVARLREAVNAQRVSNQPIGTSAVDTMMDNKYGPDAKVTTRAGKLEIGGLVQVWYYQIQNDHRGLFDDVNGTGVIDTNEHADNDSFRVRRAELSFKMDIHENVRAYVMINPANEATSFPQLGVGYKRLADVAPEFDLINGPFNGATVANVRSVQQGGGAVPSLLQDAIINFHSIIPHHDVTIGQMLPTFNEENFTYNGNLDFAERSFIGNEHPRDIGAVLHGSWWAPCSGHERGGVYQGAGDNGRLQYWLGTFNSPGNLHNSAGGASNRSDDNDYKDFIATLMVRPIWDDCWGKMELGYSYRAGRHGESGSGQPASAPVNGLDREKTWSMGHDGWFKYWAPGPIKGLWVKGETSWLHDRNAPGAIIDQLANDFQMGDGGGLADQARPFSTWGYWGAVGYRFADSPLFCNCGNSMWKNFEILCRYEDAPNVTVTDPATSGATGPGGSHTNVYHSHIITPGINYYIKGNNAKIQVNYNFVENPDGPPAAPFHNTRNDSLIVNFQVSW